MIPHTYNETTMFTEDDVYACCVIIEYFHLSNDLVEITCTVMLDITILFWLLNLENAASLLVNVPIYYHRSKHQILQILMSLVLKLKAMFHLRELT